MAELLEINLNSKYILISKKPLTDKDYENIARAWDLFQQQEGPALLGIDGTEYELVERKKEE